jgi:trehalose synthase
VLPTVPVPPKHLDEYVDAAGADVVERLRAVAEPLRGARFLQVNSTAFGGGVAELLFTQIALLNDLGIETTWALMEGSDDYFEVTKAVHNALQGADVEWTDAMVRTYRERISANAESLAEMDGHDFVLIHDPQPAALLGAVEELGRRSGKWLWRCHIDLSTPNEKVWSFFEAEVNRYDAAIFTLESFAKEGIAGPQVAFIPPSIDPLSAKNCPVNAETRREVTARYGIDPERPMITQVSRFDPWKDPLGVIDAYRLAKEAIPELQLVMIGSLAHDDPEGMRYLDLTEEHRRNDPDIHLLTNLHEVGNLEVNAFQREARIVIQKSIREGFGLVVSEGMWKEKPVIGGDVGGIRLQILDGETGFLVDSTASCAERVVELLRNPELCREMGRTGRERVRQGFLTLRELEDHLRLMASLV